MLRVWYFDSTIMWVIFDDGIVHRQCRIACRSCSAIFTSFCDLWRHSHQVPAESVFNRFGASRFSDAICIAVRRQPNADYAGDQTDRPCLVRVMRKHDLSTRQIIRQLPHRSRSHWRNGLQWLGFNNGHVSGCVYYCFAYVWHTCMFHFTSVSVFVLITMIVTTWPQTA